MTELTRITSIHQRFDTRRLMGIGYVILAVAIAFILGRSLDSSTTTTFELNLGETYFKLPGLVLPTMLTIYLLAGLCALVGLVVISRRSSKRGSYGFLAVVAALLVTSLLTWAAAGNSTNIAGLFQSTLARSVPLTLGALCGILSERTGVMYIGIDGTLLTGAFAGAVVGSIAENQWVGLAGAILAGGLLAAFYSVLVIRYYVDQIVAGIGINLMALGITSFLSARVLGANPGLNTPDRFLPIQIPVLSKIPIIGPIFFSGNLFIYLTVLMVIVIYLGLFRTRWGLRVRAVGEHPKAADTVGINVFFTRYRNVFLAGMVAGLGGAYLTLGSTGSFDRAMTAGRGFIGLAAMIFGNFNPVGAFFASLMFGFTEALQTRLSILSVAIPSEILLMIPYIVTIVVVAGVVGRVRPPAADGRPYRKE